MRFITVLLLQVAPGRSGSWAIRRSAVQIITPPEPGGKGSIA